MGEAPDAVSAELICQPILLPNLCFGTSRIRGQTQTRDREIINPIANAFLARLRTISASSTKGTISVRLILVGCPYQELRPQCNH